MKKIDFVNVVNFQIWEDVTIELEDFNVIKGSSNSGKSSLVRAINMVLNNDWHKSWLRQGEKDSTVEIHFTDGTFIRRTRGSQNLVEIKLKDEDSNTWSGFGNTYPEEVLRFLSISEENCSYQFDQHFFLSLSPTKRALTFGSFSDLQKIDEIINLVQKGIRNGDKVLKSYDLEMERLKEDLDKTNEILNIKPAVDILLEINDFTNTIENVISYKKRVNKIDRLLDCFTSMGEIDKFHKEYEMLLTVFAINSIDDELLSIDDDIINLQGKLQVEEICPTCGQLIKETHEKTKEVEIY